MSINTFHSFSEVTPCTAFVEPQLDSIDQIKADLPKNIIKNMDDSTFIPPDASSM